jgi:cation diffusion facilitator CzcD-associated flavoprotein CzcO
MAEAGGSPPVSVDVLIVGAGLSGIGTAAHLQDGAPGTSFLILEARQATGGTWDLFRYPGIRSDSDMYTMGYRFKPWTHPQAVAPGPLILDYIREAARERGIDSRILLGHRVVESQWDSATSTWTVTAQTEAGARTFTCSFLVNATGYYEYEHGYTPDFPGMNRFTGPVIHPQHWPQDFDYSGKRLVVIGSGATAITLLPNLAAGAAHVTMLQRSPTYMAVAPSIDGFSVRMRRYLPDAAVYRIGRARKICFQIFGYQMARRRPQSVKQFLIGEVANQLRGSGDIADFTPSYNPWDQRVCLVPDGDLFHAMREGRASVATGTISTFTESGIELDDGRTLAADAIITATGFTLLVGGGAKMCVDGQRIDPADALVYRGMMFSDVPNFVFVVGYSNASWTLKADLVGDHVSRLLRYMKRRGYDVCTPRRPPADQPTRPLMPLASGYIQRAKHLLPHEGTKPPWRLRQNYLLDLLTLRFGRLRDPALQFRRSTPDQSTSGPRTNNRAVPVSEGADPRVPRNSADAR